MEKGPHYCVNRELASRELTLSSEGSLGVSHSIPMEAVYLAEQGHQAYIYPCADCLERSRKNREENGHSLGYGCLIVFKNKSWRKQWCTRPGCTNNVIEHFEEVEESE